MCSATSFANDLVDREFPFGVDSKSRAQLLRQRHFLCVDVYRGHVQPQQPRILDGQVTSAADAADDQPTARWQRQFLERLVDGDAGAHDRRE
jgi:hypothetical protein